jgi:hypothetical protein
MNPNTSLAIKNKSNPVETSRPVTRQLSNSMHMKSDLLLKNKIGSDFSFTKPVNNKWIKVSRPTPFGEKPKEEEKKNIKKIVKETKEKRGNEARWSKEEDRLLFDEFSRLVKASGLKESDFKAKEKRMSKEKRDILIKLKEEFDWRGTIYSLRNRIQKRLTSSNFTAREQRVLKKKLREYANGKYTLEDVANYFAGKTVEQVTEYKNEYFNKVHLEDP